MAAARRRRRPRGTHAARRRRGAPRRCGHHHRPGRGPPRRPARSGGRVLDSGAGLAAGVLLVAGAAVRAAQFGGGGWLIRTVGAPTPVSALLHAGIVNAGGYLLIRATPGIPGEALALAALTGGITVLVCGAAVLTRPDVKGGLVMSTRAQMGFMLMQVGAGAPAAAAVHLVAHGCFKATLFLASGGAVDGVRRKRDFPRPLGAVTRPALAAALVIAPALTALVVVALTAGLLAATALPVLVGAAVLATRAGSGLVERAAAMTTRGAAGAGAGIATLTVAYVGFVEGGIALLSDAVPEGDPAVAASSVIVAVGVLLVGLAVVRSLPGTRRRLAPAADALYPTVSALGRPEPVIPPTRRVTPLPEPAVDPLTRQRIRAQVARAADVVPPLWPLSTFVAVNPFGGFDDEPFEAGMRRASALYGTDLMPDADQLAESWRTGQITDADLEAALRRDLPEAEVPPHLLRGVMLAALRAPRPSPAPVRSRAERLAPAVARAVDREVADVVACWLDDDGGWSPPDRAAGLYTSWRRTAAGDRMAWRLGARGLRRAVAALPEDPADAIVVALERLGVPDQDRGLELRRQMARLPGTAGYLRYLATHSGGGPSTGLMVELAALRLSLEALLVPDGADAAASPETPAPEEPLDAAAVLRHAGGAGDAEAAEAALAAIPPGRRAGLWLAASELAFRRRLLARIDAAPADEHVRPAAQLAFCIDVRSEGIRRHLEATGPYATLGFAGFFAIPMRFRALDAPGATDACPVILTPRHEISEAPAPGQERRVAHRSRRLRLLAAIEHAAHRAKDDPSSPYPLAEAAGLPMVVLAALRTAAPAAAERLERRLERRLAPPARLVPAVSHRPEGAADELPMGMGDAEQVFWAEAMLKAMGLASGFARLLVLAGHGATAANNPHRASLDCGACGGNRGLPNARVAATILNRPDVRHGLRERGIELPDDTVVVSALHDTTTDLVTLDLDAVPASHMEDALRLQEDLHAAGRATAAERARELPGAPRTPGDAATHVRARAADWAQVRPEWALAGCGAMVVGSRELTRGRDLGRRVFLHSYDQALDPDDTALTVILTGPLVVGHWIMMQYYGSTVAPEVFGSGSKTLHNVTAGFGVRVGPGGDIRTGLPEQSVRHGSRIQHQPLRPLAVVDAPLEKVERVISRQTQLDRLVRGRWVSVVARDGTGGHWCERMDDGTWQPIAATAGIKEVTR
ncbi:MAG: putative inorganic carbon transporter subunit DabA [Thermoleophilia bacterium]